MLPVLTKRRRQLKGKITLEEGEGLSLDRETRNRDDVE